MFDMNHLQTILKLTLGLAISPLETLNLPLESAFLQIKPYDSCSGSYANAAYIAISVRIYRSSDAEATNTHLGQRRRMRSGASHLLHSPHLALSSPPCSVCPHPQGLPPGGAQGELMEEMLHSGPH